MRCPRHYVSCLQGCTPQSQSRVLASVLAACQRTIVAAMEPAVVRSLLPAAVLFLVVLHLADPAVEWSASGYDVDAEIVPAVGVAAPEDNVDAEILPPHQNVCARVCGFAAYRDDHVGEQPHERVQKHTERWDKKLDMQI